MVLECPLISKESHQRILRDHANEQLGGRTGWAVRWRSFKYSSEANWLIKPLRALRKILNQTYLDIHELGVEIYEGEIISEWSKPASGLCAFRKRGQESPCQNGTRNSTSSIAKTNLYKAMAYPKPTAITWYEILKAWSINTADVAAACVRFESNKRLIRDTYMLSRKPRTLLHDPFVRLMNCRFRDMTYSSNLTWTIGLQDQCLEGRAWAQYQHSLESASQTWEVKYRHPSPHKPDFCERNDKDWIRCNDKTK